MIDEDGKTERIALRVSPNVKKTLKRIAKDENRTLANWCENAIMEKLKMLKIDIIDDKEI